MEKPKLVIGLGIAQYKVLHKRGIYDEDSISDKDLKILHGLVIGSQSKTILDYGSGVGKQYTERHKNRLFAIKDQNVFCYDPAVVKYNQIQHEAYDGVICTDVLEHVPEGKELDTALYNIFLLATKFVYISVFCALANTTLPNGKNAHCTIKSPPEWKRIITKANLKQVPLIVAYRHRIDGRVLT